MSRPLKVLPLALATAVVAALSVLAASCNTSGSTEVRLINGLSNNGNPYVSLDVYVNGAKLNSTALGYASVYPAKATPAAYAGVPPGSDTVEAFDTGTTTPAILNSVTEAFTGGGEYTLVLSGSVNNLDHPPTAFLFKDNNTLPTTGNVEFRVINGSVASQQFSGSIDVYILPQGTQPNGNPQIPGLAYGSDATGYMTMTYLNGTEYTFWVTPHSSTTPIASQSFGPVNQQITTLVLTDNQYGSAIASPPFVYLDDMN